MTTRPRKWTTNSMIGQSLPPSACHKVLTPTPTAGAGGGLVSSVATCPLDVIKTKLQAQRAAVGQPGYLGVAGTILPFDLLNRLGHIWPFRHHTQSFPRGRAPWVLQRPRSHHARLPSNVGHLFCCVRRHQDILWPGASRSASVLRRSTYPRQIISSCPGKGLSTRNT